MTKLEIIAETAAYYSNPSNRGKKPEGGCFYLTKDGKMCAFGRCMIDPSYLAGYGGLEDGEFLGANKGVTKHFTQELLKPEYRGHNSSFWSALQNWHDDDSNFTETEISNIGILSLESLRTRHAD